MQDDAQVEIIQYPYSHELPQEHRIESARSKAWNDISRWRKAERKRLIDERLALTPEERQIRSGRIASLLDSTIGNFAGRIVGSYWPFRGEPDLRNWGIMIIERGGRIALPVVVQKGWPLEYRTWSPGDPLERGFWNMLVPARGSAVQPDIVIAPVVGFDDANYRLGYGGGFFDRTLATMTRKPLSIGVGYAQSWIPTVYPQHHDVPMDVIVTD
ncbi:5-formyltetrahydrofolate cyclo-ligase [Mesorhizobium sp. BAC0120]|uniref:5-formyltetrahydrofolate cyclo-ligase n=1 Tax=Mesorhizobium sp. BAC0120 TaxID=3090670 RepID=UPI00298CA2AE|nr:5-formyltetrahydrofolate cyclo-ligase [Mesorhizobium sp. BAC0120]MDW6023353.1 5-formyltetrahydrofolate cyclo-ligase [Mesorhizobium sp. BAC0120]